MDIEFVSSFIADAASKDQSPIELAKNEIAEIDNALSEAEKLKHRRMLLMSVLEFLDDSSFKRRRANSIPSSDDVDISSSDMRDLILKIKNVIKSKAPITVRNLIIEVGGYDNDALIMRTVKYLGEQDIIERNKSGQLLKGKCWNKEIN